MSESIEKAFLAKGVKSGDRIWMKVPSSFDVTFKGTRNKGLSTTIAPGEWPASVYAGIKFADKVHVPIRSKPYAAEHGLNV